MEDSLREPSVLITEQEEGIATVTISVYDEDHKFEIWADGDIAKVSYEETLSFRGTIEVSMPDDDIIKELMVSDPVTEFLDEYNLDRVQMENRNT